MKLNTKIHLLEIKRNQIKVYEDDLSNIYNSRTFCLFEDRKIKNEFSKRWEFRNAIVVKGDKILNQDKLRNKIEFVNHKILDCMGDLYLSGYKIIGKLTCSQGGHKLTNQLLRKVFSENSNFSIIEVKREENIPHSFINKNILESIAEKVSGNFYIILYKDLMNIIIKFY